MVSYLTKKRQGRQHLPLDGFMDMSKALKIYARSTYIVHIEAELFSKSRIQIFIPVLFQKNSS